MADGDLTDVDLTAARARFLCVGCGFDTHRGAEYFMVRHDIWHLTGLDVGDVMLCVGCVEARIGRTLEPADFLDVDLNYDPAVPRSPRLQERLGLWFKLPSEVRQLVHLHRVGAL